jgi:hypothetical protein
MPTLTIWQTGALLGVVIGRVPDIGTSGVYYHQQMGIL